MIDNGGNRELGLTIEIAAAAMAGALGIGLVVVGQKHKLVLARRESVAKLSKKSPPQVFRAQESESYEHDVGTVWALIRPAESATLLGDARRAFTVPGTPTGVGEQQCFIAGDGSVSIVEVVAEESERWSTTRVVTPSEVDIRATFQLEPTATGCLLQVGVALEGRISSERLSTYEESWRGHARRYLARVTQILDLQHGQ